MKAMHILAGIIALLAGFVALYAAKGQWLHRRSGNIFSYAMLVMAGSGALIAAFISFNRINIIAGTLTFYLVATGLLTVIRSVEEQRRWLIGLGLVAFAATGSAWVFGFMAQGLPGGKLDHIPAGAIFMFAVVGTVSLIGDARVLLAGRIEGPRRLHRHLWRMGYALWIASTSAFLGQARHLPDWVRESHLQGLPILAVTVTVLFWLVRVRLYRRKPIPGRPLPSQVEATSR